jgi:hypothetical protein
MIEEFIDLFYVLIDRMIADDLIKSLIRNKFVQFRAALEIESSTHFATMICES